jgi:hypothetical protein
MNKRMLKINYDKESNNKKYCLDSIKCNIEDFDDILKTFSNHFESDTMDLD